MLVLGQAASAPGLSSSSTTASVICPSVSLKTSSSSSSSSFKLIRPQTTPFSRHKTISNLTQARERQRLIIPSSAKSSNEGTSGSQQSVSTLTGGADGPVLVDGESAPLEGVIQFEKPNNYSSRVEKWGKIALLAGGDVLALVLFSAIGRFSHGFSVLEFETLRTADPFIAGWFLSAYFLGGYSEDGRGLNGLNKAVAAAAKSWALGIPLGLGIRGLTTGHFPPNNFILVTLGSTAFLLIGWRALLFSIFPASANKKDDMYRKGSPFELFELLTSLIRRW